MIDLPALKRALNIPEGYTEHDGYLIGLEAAALASAERRTGGYWGEPQAATPYLEGAGTPDLWLPDHASEVTRVVERLYPNAQETALDEGAYALRLDPGSTHGLRLVRLGGVWCRGADYAVTYTRGYEAGQEPADIRQAALGLVALWFEQRLPVALGTVAPPVPNHVAAILAARRKGMA